MKKLLYILAFTIVACTSLSSCTEEVVKPKEGENKGGLTVKE